MSSINLRKAAIIGSGFVGSTSAFALMQSGLFSDIVLIDSDIERAEGEALDIGHGMPLANPTRIYAGNYDDASDAAIIIVTAGAHQKPDETRLELVKRNVAIFRSVIPEIPKRHFEGIILVVANPVDILTYAAVKFSGMPSKRVIGSGTLLDTMRMKFSLSEYLNVSSKNIHAYMIGEQGDNEFTAWSSANVSGVPLLDFCKMRMLTRSEETLRMIEAEVRNSTNEIIKRKHATYYGIAMSVKRICEAVIHDDKCVLPVSSMINNLYGIRGVVLSLPSIIGKDGVEDILPIKLNGDEQNRLINSAEALNGIINEVL